MCEPERGKSSGERSGSGWAGACTLAPLWPANDADKARSTKERWCYARSREIHAPPTLRDPLGWLARQEFGRLALNIQDHARFGCNFMLLSQLEDNKHESSVMNNLQTMPPLCLGHSRLHLLPVLHELFVLVGNQLRERGW